MPTEITIDVHVVIPAYNNADIIADCILSIPRDESIVVTVVDNASADDTAEVVRSRFPYARLIVNKENKGFAAACNAAAKTQVCRYLLFLNSDARLKNNTINSLANYLEKDKRAGIVCPQLIYPDGAPQNSFSGFPSLLTECFNKSVLKVFFPRRFGGKRWEKGTKPFYVDAPVGACMMVKSSEFRALGGFDEDYFFFLEETDFSLRLMRNGRTVLFCPDVNAVHLQGHSAKKDTLWAKTSYYKSMLIFFKKHRKISFHVYRLWLSGFLCLKYFIFKLCGLRESAAFNYKLRQSVFS